MCVCVCVFVCVCVCVCECVCVCVYLCVCVCSSRSPLLCQANVESYVFILGGPSVLYVGYHVAKALESLNNTSTGNAFFVRPPLRPPHTGRPVLGSLVCPSHRVSGAG